MKIARYRLDGRARVGIVDGDTIADAGDDLFDPRPSGASIVLSQTTLLPPVERPGKIVCVGLNYRDHAAESGMAPPERPILFSKFANAVAAHGDPIEIPTITQQVDYEAELGVIIGRTARAVDARHALDHVLGYTCVNDVSARELQFGDGQWLRGKTLDTFCPIGPWIVTRDEIPDPQALPIRCTVNGTRLQDSNTAQMIFGVAELIAFITEAITLEPGDVIATGTPAGVGFARTPPVFLRPGDSVTVDIGGIGALTNPVTARP